MTFSRSQLLSISRSEGGVGPQWRRIDGVVPGCPTVWGSLLDFGRRFLLEDLDPMLPPFPAKTFATEDEALDWLVAQINEVPGIVETVTAYYAREAAERAALSDVDRALAKAKADRERVVAELRAERSEMVAGG